jgi:UDP-2-acetamido-2-deoxy-ribo-hexuluronate aminotransferase
MIPLVDLKGEYNLLKEEIQNAIHNVLQSGSYILGEKGRELEQKIASLTGTSYAAGVANGTDALILSLEALGIGHGDEVITTPFTFFATAEAISSVGAIPVFVDIDSITYNLNPNLIEQCITDRTKAIMVVHLFGQPADMDAIRKVASEFNLKVIEDACQTIHSTYKGKSIGSFGDISCFSFYPSKNLGAYGDGGMIVTNDNTLYERILLLRNHGSLEKYKHRFIGYNSRLDEVQAAILLVKLKMITEWIDRRKDLAKRYTAKLSEFVGTPTIELDREHTFHQYCIKLKNRDGLVVYLKEKGIATAIYYPIPLHLMEAYHSLYYKKGDFPIAENTANSIMALPIFPTMTLKQQDYVISSLMEFIGNQK